MTRIFDNLTEQLGPKLQESLRDHKRMDAAVGYMSLRGWSEFGAIVAAKVADGSPAPVARILIGMVAGADQQQALEELQQQLEGSLGDPFDPIMDHDTGWLRKKALMAHLREQLMRGIPTSKDRKALQQLKEQIQSGAVELKVFTRRPLHGKTYIFHKYDPNHPRTAFVGSSNLTTPGMTSNLELNVDVLEFHATDRLARWFKDRWEDPFSYVISEDLLELLDESWAGSPLPPYDVYLKLCYDMSRDVREGLAEYSLPSEIQTKLLDYQRDAVRTLVRRIVTRGGTMLGDAVGLGKTLTATAVAILMGEEYQCSTLVVCPKNLSAMWTEHLEAYRIPGRVVTYPRTTRELPDLRRFKFVIVDESHTLRNDETQAYKALHDYIRLNDCWVLLLTATPYNIGFNDVANQIGLWIDPDDDLGLEPSQAMALNPNLAHQLDGRTSTLAAFKKSEEPVDWQRLMSEHLVRRTRSFVKRRAEEAGQVDERGVYLKFADDENFYFPARDPRPIEHSFGPDDPAALMASEDTLDVLKDLALPRYDLSRYLTKRDDYSAAEKAAVERWRRSRGQVAGFVRTNFYKRLSSCGFSFDLSVRRHIARNELFLYALDESLPVPTGTVEDAMFKATDSDEDVDTEIAGEADVAATPAQNYEALLAKSPTSVTWVRSELFTGEMVKQLRRDTDALNGLLRTFGEWSVDRDSKMKALTELLTVEHPDEKVLIFTEYKDTAQYVADSLKNADIDAVGLATGEVNNPTAVAHQFAPKSNRLPGEAAPDVVGEELRVLVATDVLSEGQNLQDAHIIVNYDLPWAIIRLIQRAGRVDRIGQESDTVTLYSFFHGSLDNVLTLRQRIHRRLADNARAFGNDEEFFGSPEETHFIEDLFHGKLDDAKFEPDVDAATLAFEIWDRATRDDPVMGERIAALPDLAMATMKAPTEESAAGVACNVRTDSGQERYGFAYPSGAVSTITSHEALSAYHCRPDTPAEPTRSDHDDLLAALVKGPEAVLARRKVFEGQMSGVRRSVWNRLMGDNATSQGPELLEALDAMSRSPLTAESQRKLRQALHAGDNEVLADLLEALHRDGRLVLARGERDPIRIVSSMGIIE